MNIDIIKLFNQLPAGSTILNNGDICLGNVSFEQLKEIISQLKANDKKLWIILGNHDREIQKFLKKQNFKTAYELFKELGFDRVFEHPILLEGKYLFSHEPVYLNGNIKNVYGHTHDVEIDKDYFNRECENWAMMKKVELIEQIDLNINTEIVNKNLEIDTNNYYNVCLDCRHKLVPFKEIVKYFER